MTSKFSSTIESRRSVRYFRTGMKLSDGTVRELIRLATCAPSAFNLQHWRFVVIRDATVRRRMCTAAFHQRQVEDAGAVIVVCADLKSWDKQPGQCWSHTPGNVRSNMVSSIQQCYAGNEQLERDEALRSAALAGMTLMLAAQDMGYDSCPLTGFDYATVAQLINLPSDHVICMLVTVGKRAADPLPRGGRRSLADIIYYDGFSEPSQTGQDEDVGLGMISP